MSRLPTVGADSDNWGSVLNDYLTETASTAVLAASPSAGATSISLGVVPAGLTVGSVIAIDPFTSELELRTVAGVSGNTITVAALTYAHAGGDPVFLHDGNLVPWTWAGAVPNNDTYATENTTAFNRIGLEILGLGSTFGAGGIFIPDGTWWVDDELLMQHSQTIAGTSPDRSIIKAHDDFPFDATGEVAIMHGTRSGSGNTNYADGGPLSRYYLRDFLVDGRNLADSNGILASLQQPAHWENVRVNFCVGLYGFSIHGQHSRFSNLEAQGCTCAMRCRGATIMSFDGLSFEQTQGTATVIVEDTDLGAGCFDLSFSHVHFEPDQETIGFDVQGGATGLSFRDFWYTNNETGTGIKFDTPLTNPGDYCRYVITNFRCNTNSSTFNMIDDSQRSYSLDSLSDTDRMIMLLAAHTNVAWLSPSGWVEIP